jgi:peptide/nickel transport system permease protein
LKLIRQILNALLTLFLSLSLLFILIRLAPGDPIERILGPEATDTEIQNVREDLGLNKPLFVQYSGFMFGVASGKLGKSLYKDVGVMELLKSHMPPTVVIAFFAILLSTTAGVFIGIFSGFKKSQFPDKALRIVTLTLLAFPIFSLAPILVLLFSVKLGLLPVSEWGTLAHAILPILSLSLPLGAIISRVTRNRYLEERRAPWVIVLKSKGLSELAILLRVTKACLPTIFNVVAIQLSVVLAGTMITETIFDIPGMGMLLFEGIQNRDYPVVQGVIAYSTMIYLLIYFVVDGVNARIDPRIQR